MRDVFRPRSGVTPRLVLAMVMELPDTSDTVASIRASMPAPAGDSEVVNKIRTRRNMRGWGADRELLAAIFHATAGNPYPRPWDDGDSGFGGRTVVEDMASVGF